LPLGPDDFADYARAMEAGRFLVAPEERQSVRGGRRKWVRNRPADETRNEHATVRSLRRLDCWKPFSGLARGVGCYIPETRSLCRHSTVRYGPASGGPNGGPCYG